MRQALGSKCPPSLTPTPKPYRVRGTTEARSPPGLDRAHEPRGRRLTPRLRAHALRPPAGVGGPPLPGGGSSRVGGRRRGRRASGPLAEPLVTEPAGRERAGSFVAAVWPESRAPIAGLTVTPAV
uniref:putative uncharacterized protein encoded by MAPKAPK5-AS1 n=1 Tax=Odobenus rosmarus divergens TaxID=9708 RepID=UPI00063CCDA7|nr:PREDICTED: putative uncharacterized protein encoded by MAPKAPK5-AS1 [Odobenus rosmarus divergens]